MRSAGANFFVMYGEVTNFTFHYVSPDRSAYYEYISQ